MVSAGGEIIVTIAPDGTIKVEAQGYTGPGCVDAVKKFSEALGLEEESEHKPEFYLESEEETGLQLGGGSW